jgi:hypothetical protein
MERCGTRNAARVSLSTRKRVAGRKSWKPRYAISIKTVNTVMRKKIVFSARKAFLRLLGSGRRKERAVTLRKERGSAKLNIRGAWRDAGRVVWRGVDFAGLGFIARPAVSKRRKFLPCRYLRRVLIPSFRLMA